MSQGLKKGNKGWLWNEEIAYELLFLAKLKYFSKTKGGDFFSRIYQTRKP